MKATAVATTAPEAQRGFWAFWLRRPVAWKARGAANTPVTVPEGYSPAAMAGRSGDADRRRLTRVDLARRFGGDSMVAGRGMPWWRGLPLGKKAIEI